MSNKAKTLKSSNQDALDESDTVRSSSILEKSVKTVFSAALPWSMTRIIISILLALTFVTGIYSVYHYSLVSRFFSHKSSGVVPLGDPFQNVVFYQMNDVLVNLRSNGKTRSPLLKVSLGIECTLAEGDEAEKTAVSAQIAKLESRIKDQFIMYLRDLDISDLQGSAGLQRLKEELTERANGVLAPLRVSRLLLNEFLIQ